MFFRGTIGVLFLLAAAIPSFTGEPPNSLAVSAVQFEIDVRTAVNREALEGKIASAVETAAGDNADLVVFPEYINVFPALSADEQLIEAFARMDFSADKIGSAGGGSAAGQRLPAGSSESGSRVESGRNLVRTLLASVYRHTGHRSLRSLFAARAEGVSRWMDEVYGEAADRHDVHIVAGTYFAFDEQGRRGTLTNRAVVYAPDGTRSYEQDKVFLTAFERDLLGLDAAEVENASGFTVDGWSVALTICRDTYFEAWNTVHGERDLWIDIRGEGTEYNAEVRRRLEGAVPERISETDVSYGLTVFLTGEFHGLYWEGRSAFVEESGDSVERLSEANATTGHDIVSAKIGR